MIMKTCSKIIISIVLIFPVIAGYSLDNKSEKFVDKLTEKIEEAAPDDWYVLAHSADLCLKKNINTKDVAEWIDRSLSIKETPYNLEVKGDYYMINRMPKKAGEFYLKALKVGADLNDGFDGTELQKKIAEIINLKVM